MGVGVLLLGDGFRKFIEGGFSGAFAGIIVGSACIYITGYKKQVALTESGFSRKRIFWGKGRVDSLSWDEMEEVVLFPSDSGTTVLLPFKDRGWRVFLPGIAEDEVRDHISRFGGGVSVRTGEAIADE